MKNTKIKLTEIEDETGSIGCTFLKDKYRDPETGCRPVVYKASVILERITDRELRK